MVSSADNVINYINKGYNLNDIVYSIINLITEKCKVAPWQIMRIKSGGQSSLKKYLALQAKKELTPEDFRLALKYKTESLEAVPNAKQWGRLIEYPNPDDTWQEFIANGIGYKLITGNKYIHAELLTGGSDGGTPNTLCLLPSQWINIIVNKLQEYQYPMDILGYRVTLLPNRVFPVEEVMHEKYMNYNWDTAGSQLYGMAPLKAALKRVDLSNSGMDTNIAKIQNGGLESIVYVDDARMSIEQGRAQAETIKGKLIHEYSGPVNWGKIATSGYKMGAVNLGLSPVELNLYKAELANLRFLCNVFGGVPSQIFNDPENKSFNNAKEGEKALTARCALPALIATRDNFNRKAHTNWNFPLDWFMDFDMSVYTELQETIGETMRWVEPLLNKGWPLNEALKVLNIAPLDEVLADEMWIRPDMGVPLSDWRITDPNNAANETGTNAPGKGGNK